jgi:hypothetical protein
MEHENTMYCKRKLLSWGRKVGHKIGFTYQYHGTTCENHVLQAKASEMGRVESYPQLQTKAPSSPDHALLSWGEKLLPDKFRTARKPSIFCIYGENGISTQTMRMVSN